MIKINPYLNFAGNTEEAFNFYKSVFGGEFISIQRFKDMKDDSMSDDMKISPKDGDKIMHISLPIGNDGILMGNDHMPSMGSPLKVGDNFNLYISVDSEKEADQIFSKLSAGGKVEMAMSKTSWGSYFGMCVDKFGVWWMVDFDYDKK